MKPVKTLIILCAVLVWMLGTVSAGWAQVNLKKVGQSTMNFLKVSVSPRAAALGNSLTVLSNDASSVFYNPSGLADINSGSSLFLSRTQWIAGINYTAGSAAHNLGNFGTLAVSALNVDYGDIPRTVLLSKSDPQGYEKQGQLNVGAYALGLGYARKISTQFQMGGQLQYVGHTLGQSELDSETVTNQQRRLVANFGVQFQPGWKKSRFGMAIRNFSSQVKYEEVGATLPMVFLVGAGIDLVELLAPEQASGHSFMVTSEFVHPNNYTERINLGGEYSVFNGLIALRAGYQFNRDLQGLGAGFGLSPSIGSNQVTIDYSYNAMRVFGGVNRFALGVEF